MAMVQEIGSASIDSIQVNTIDTTLDGWMEDLRKLFTNGEVPAEEDPAMKVRLRALRFEMKEGRLYKRS